MPVSLTRSDLWRRRRRTGHAMALLVKARLLLLIVPFRRWRGSLGYSESGPPLGTDAVSLPAARHLASHVERAAWRLPFECKCLPRAMALSWMLQEEAVSHGVVIAVRPPDRRAEADALHAWVEVAGRIVLGELPGPWHEIYRTDG